MSIEIRNRRRFNRSLDEFADSLGLEVVTVQKKLAFDIFGDLVAQTPVLTGRAMNNWNIAVGSPDHGITDEGGGGSAIASLKQAAALGELSALAPGQTVWLSNSLDYIIPLSEGSSQQAPNGWIDRAVFNNLNALGAAA